MLEHTTDNSSSPIQSTADASPKDPTSQLFNAVEDGLLPELLQALEAGGDPNVRKLVSLRVTLADAGEKEVGEDLEVESALAVAIRMGRADLVKGLVAAGADPNLPISWKISNCYSSWTAKEWEEERWYADAWMSHPSALSLALASGPRAFNLPGRQILLRNISDWQQSYEGFTLQPTLDVVTALLHVGTKVSEEDRRVARSLARGVNSFGNAIEPQPMFADAVEKHLSDLSKVPPRVDAVLGSRWSAGDSSNIVDVEGDEGDDDVRSLLIARQSADRDFLDADDIHELGLLRGNNSRLKIVKPVARPATANSTTPIAPPTGYSEVGSPLTEHSALYAEQGRHLAEAQKVIAALSVSAKEREVANAEERALLAAERLAQLSLVEAQARVIAEQSKEIARIGEIVRERERELAEMEKVVVKHQGTVERLERELTIEKEVGEGLQREMAMERDRNIDLQRDHKDQRLEISELQQLLHSANGQISDLELSLQAAENSIADLEREFTQERNRNVTIQSEVRSQREEIEELQDVLHEANRRVEELETELEARDTRVAELEAERRAQEAVEEDHVKELAELRSVIRMGREGNGSLLASPWAETSLNGSARSDVARVRDLEAANEHYRTRISSLERELVVERSQISFLENGQDIRKRRLSGTGRHIPPGKGAFITQQPSSHRHEASSTVAHTPPRRLQLFVVTGFRPTRRDEIALAVGQEVVCMYVFGDDWAAGMNKDTIQSGFFPLKCVASSPPLDSQTMAPVLSPIPERTVSMTPMGHTHSIVSPSTGFSPNGHGMPAVALAAEFLRGHTPTAEANGK